MVFNSLSFLAFFAIVLAVDRLPLPWAFRKVNLLIASYVFYGAWKPAYVLLLIFAAVVDFCLARMLDRIESPGWRRAMLVFSLTLNIGLLAYFKYGVFLAENALALLGWFGLSRDHSPPSIILPLGISFYTFETISYLVDVYRRRIKAWHSFIDYSLFLTFFPHLVAGPIVRADDFLPQLRTSRRATADQMGWGLSLLIVGLFEKMILADLVCRPVVDKVYDATGGANFLDGWAGTMAFAAQILFDFSGYSTCAIGLALCLGFSLKDNFHFPYAAVGFSDFWRRWHISLSTWLRDYLYIPLGGNRRGTARNYANLMVTMLLGGLWHGASWRFVAWGGLHGLFLVGERLYKAAQASSRGGVAARADRSEGGDASSGRGLGRAIGRLGPVAGMLATFALVNLTWVFFRAEDFSTAFRLISRMVGWSAGPSAGGLVDPMSALKVFGLTAVMLASQWWARDSSLEGIAARLPWWARSVVLSAMIVLLCLAFARGGDDHAFIYFQF